MEDESIYKNGLKWINKVNLEYKFLSLIEKKPKNICGSSDSLCPARVQGLFYPLSGTKMDMPISALKHKHRVSFSLEYSQVAISRCLKSSD